MIFAHDQPDADPLRRRLRAALDRDEAECVLELIAAARGDDAARARVAAAAAALVEGVRRLPPTGLDAFLREYQLSSREGVVLMCLAEALLRIPDADTRNLLIRDKLAAGDWAGHLGHSGSPFVNASTWALMLTGRLMRGIGDEAPAPRPLVHEILR